MTDNSSPQNLQIVADEFLRQKLLAFYIANEKVLGLDLAYTGMLCIGLRISDGPTCNGELTATTITIRSRSIQVTALFVPEDYDDMAEYGKHSAYPFIFRLNPRRDYHLETAYLAWIPNASAHNSMINSL